MPEEREPRGRSGNERSRRARDRGSRETHDPRVGDKGLRAYLKAEDENSSFRDAWRDVTREKDDNDD